LLRNSSSDVMGNSMLKPLKTKTDFMLDELGDKFDTDFEKNKKTISNLKLPFSKKTVNRMAGYAVRVKKRVQKKNKAQDKNQMILIS